MFKGMTPVEVYDQSIIDGAVYYTAFQFRGPFDRVKVRCDTLSEARGVAAGLRLEHTAHGAIVYAIDARGRQAVVS